jgi:HEAT repeat protein
MTHRTFILLWIALGSCMAAAQAPQQTPAMSQAVSLAQGWAYLAQLNPAKAIEQATLALQKNPRNTDAASLLVQATIQRDGAAAGLTAYERWLGARRLDEAHILRHVALAELREQAKDTNAPHLRRAAYLALAAEGDPQALIDLDRNFRAGGLAETQILSSLGSDDATRKLIAQLDTTPGSRVQLISALGASHNKLAVAPLVGLLSDANADTRAFAAEALGQLGQKEAVEPLKKLLTGQPTPVVLMAAGALFRLDDMSGLALLREKENSEYPGVRLAALRLTAANPDETWLRGVRALAQDPDPDIRRQAAELIAPFDPETARTVVMGLMTDSNIAIREDAVRLFVEKVITDVATLRRYLHSTDSLERIHAADRLLALTR